VDNSGRAPICRFAPSRPLGLTAAAAALLAVAVAVATSDDSGRLLAGIAAVVLVSVAGNDLIFAPRLEASADGMAIRSPTVWRTLPWTEIDSIRVDERSRLGLASRTLEIDAGDVLVVLSRHALGADPREVATLVQSFLPS